MMRSKMARTGMFLAMALGMGCEGESKLNVVVEEGANAPHVNLPSVPTLPPPPPTNHTDGSMTVYGVRHLAARVVALEASMTHLRLDDDRRTADVWVEGGGSHI